MSTKRIINKDAILERQREKDSQKPLPESADEANIKISDFGSWLRLDVNKSFLNSSSNFDIMKVLSIALSPFFTNENKQPKVSAASPQIERHGVVFPRVGFFVESVTHYTGGRYSTFMYALLLSQFTDVTWVCNERPLFEKDFTEYNQGKFRIVVDRHFLLNSQDCEFDIVVGTPVVGGSFAAEYAKKFGARLFSVLFESPNWISQFRDGADADESFWKGYKEVCKASELIIVPSHESEQHFRKWDEEFKSKIVCIIYPPINELAIRKVENKIRHKDWDERRQEERKQKGWKKEIVYSTRMAPFKNPLTIIKRLGEDIAVHIIGKVWSDTRPEFEKKRNVILHGVVSDKKKLEVISKCDAMIFPTNFEGAGMPPAEALRFKVPVIATDLPVLREIYEGHIYYVEKQDPEQFVAILRSILNDPPNMINQHSPDVMTMGSVSENMRQAFGIPSVTAGMIHYNCWEYIEYAIRAIYPVVSKIVLVHGRVEKYPKSSFDIKADRISLEALIDEVDYLNKIELVIGEFKDKVEMQNEIAKRVDTEYYVKVDADEIWDARELMNVVGYLEQNPEVKYMCMPFLHFWTNFKTIARDAGGKWGTKHPRVWRWNKGMFHFKSFNFFVDSDRGRLPVKPPHYKHKEWKGRPIYHFGWARPIQVALQKLKYYESRGIETYTKDNYSTWKKLDDPTMCTQPVRSWAELFNGELPDVMKSHPWIEVEDIRQEMIK